MTLRTLSNQLAGMIESGELRRLPCATVKRLRTIQLDIEAHANMTRYVGIVDAAKNAAKLTGQAIQPAHPGAWWRRFWA